MQKPRSTCITQGFKGHACVTDLAGFHFLTFSQLPQIFDCVAFDLALIFDSDSIALPSAYFFSAKLERQKSSPLCIGLPLHQSKRAAKI